MVAPQAQRPEAPEGAASYAAPAPTDLFNCTKPIEFTSRSSTISLYDRTTALGRCGSRICFNCTIGAFFHWAGERGELAEIPKIKHLNVEQSPPNVPTEAEVAMLFQRIAVLRAAAPTERDARSYSQEFADANYSCVALLVGDPVSAVIGSFFVGLNRPNVPTKLFSDE